MARRCRSCQTVAAPRKRNCQACGKKLPTKRRQPHMKGLEFSYEYYLALNDGIEQCGICGRGPGTRKLHRDHEHKGDGKPRGLLCHICNRRLRGWMTPFWLLRASRYLERTS